MRPCVRPVCTWEDGVFYEREVVNARSLLVFPSSGAVSSNTKHHLLRTLSDEPHSEEEREDVSGSRARTRASIHTVAFLLPITEYPFNCKALTWSGHFWRGRSSLLTFLTQFPRKPVFLCTWKQEREELTQRCPCCAVTTPHSTAET